MCVVFVLVYVYDWQGRMAVADCQANNQSINQSMEGGRSGILCFSYQSILLSTIVLNDMIHS